jgi:hypothetical protein
MYMWSQKYAPQDPGLREQYIEYAVLTIPLCTHMYAMIEFQYNKHVLHPSGGEFEFFRETTQARAILSTLVRTGTLVVVP